MKPGARRLSPVKSCLAAVLSFAFLMVDAQGPLRLNPKNPHYLEYRGKPVILITSAEHYGALINTAFDYARYLNTLAEQGMNNTRIFSGTYVEREEDIKWMLSRNTLAPDSGKLICPWARSSVAGYRGGGNKFDLDRWDENYFARLKDILVKAAAKDIFIEFTLFGNQYGDGTWANSPLFPDNNIQGEGPSGDKSFLLFTSMKNKALLTRQEDLVKKLLLELNGYDNLYFEICNEPHNDVVDTLAVHAWHARILNLIKNTEAALPKKHLIASNEVIIDSPGISIVNYHYVKILTMPDFDSLYRLNKVISMDETLGSLVDARLSGVRIEAWDFIFKGGGAYDNLSWDYTPADPAGTDSAKLVRLQLQYLQQFMAHLHYLPMRRDTRTVIKKPGGATVRMLSEKGKQYAAYLHHSKEVGGGFLVTYAAVDKAFRDTLVLDLPAGTYDIRFYNPSTGRFTGGKNTFTHTGGPRKIVTPVFVTDMAILLARKTGG